MVLDNCRWCGGEGMVEIDMDTDDAYWLTCIGCGGKGVGK